MVTAVSQAFLDTVQQKWAGLRLRMPSAPYEVAFHTSCITFATNSSYEKRWFKRNTVGGHFRNFHEPTQTILLERLSAGRNRFLDLGSHLGYFSILMASVADAEVVAVEFDPSNYAALCRQIAEQPAAACARVRTINAGISDRQGTVRLPSVRTNSPVRRLCEEPAEGPTTEVPLTSIDALLVALEFAPDIVKVDIEGHELIALSAATMLLDEVRPILLVELHPDVLARHEATPQDVVDLMAAKDYAAFEVVDHRSRGVSPLYETRAVAARHNLEVVFVPRDDGDALSIVRAFCPQRDAPRTRARVIASGRAGQTVGRPASAVAGAD